MKMLRQAQHEELKGFTKFDSLHSILQTQIFRLKSMNTIFLYLHPELVEGSY